MSDTTEMSARPQGRIQLSRKKGFRLPADAASVAWPTRWANPYRPLVRSLEANLAAVYQYETYLKNHPALLTAGRTTLKRYHWLACWCPPEMPCHADVWIHVCTMTDDDLAVWVDSERE